MDKVFVYGTLRKGESNHGLLASSPSVSMSAYVAGIMVDTGLGYPAMMEGAGQVFGEIYLVDAETLRRIDDLEDYYGPDDPRNLYDRLETTAYTEQGEVKVWAYYSSSNRFSYVSPIASGDWKRCARSK